MQIVATDMFLELRLFYSTEHIRSKFSYFSEILTSRLQHALVTFASLYLFNWTAHVNMH